MAIVGLSFLVFIFLFSFIGPYLSPYSNTVNPTNLHQSPSLEHWLGTDNLGRDVLTRLMLAGRISLTIATENYKELGVDFQVEQMDFNALLSRVDNGEHDLASFSTPMLIG